MHLRCSPNGIRAALRQRDTAELAILDVFSEGLDGVFDRDAGVDAGTLEDVEGFGGAEDAEALVDAAADVFRAAVGAVGDGVEAAFYRDDDFGRVLRVGGEVGVEELEGIGVWWTTGRRRSDQYGAGLRGIVVGDVVLEFAPVPEVCTGLESCFHCCESLLLWWRLVDPSQTWKMSAPVLTLRMQDKTSYSPIRP